MRHPTQPLALSKLAVAILTVLAFCPLAPSQSKPPLDSEEGAAKPQHVRSASAVAPGALVPFTLPSVTTTTHFHGDYSFTIQVPAGATLATFELQTQTPNADVDLYVRRNADVERLPNGRPLADYISEGLTGNESITIPSPPAGTYYIGFGLFTLNVSPSATIRATVNTPGGGSTTYNGTWSGTTAQGRNITLTVSSNIVTQVVYTINWSAGFSCPASSTSTLNVNLPIINGSFSNPTIAGSFSSATTTSGTLNAALSIPPPQNCNQTINTTWTATLQVSSSYSFVPVAPCRVADTRAGGGKTGPFGPPNLAASSTREIPIPQSSCNVPSTAKAYSLNFTTIPRGILSYLSTWPAGQTQPLVSTLNSFHGGIVANAAIVPAGANGAINVFVTEAADVVVDINGYFDSPTASNALDFYSLTPCRAADTRGGFAGMFGPPNLSPGSRLFPLLSSSCAVPTTARAYSLNATVVPPGPLAYLTLYPAGTTQPLVSTLNSFEGGIVANAAIVPGGNGGAINAFATDPTDLVLDMNGYFAPASPGSLKLYPVTPCRVADTRGGQGPIMAGATSRVFPMAGVCGVPFTAQAFSLNVTVVPSGPLAYLTLWPTGQNQPTVSTLNSFQGRVLANAAIVPAGAGGAVTIFATNLTHVILDINGYFAP